MLPAAGSAGIPVRPRRTRGLPSTSRMAGSMLQELNYGQAVGVEGQPLRVVVHGPTLPRRRLSSLLAREGFDVARPSAADESVDVVVFWAGDSTVAGALDGAERSSGAPVVLVASAATRTTGAAGVRSAGCKAPSTVLSPAQKRRRRRTRRLWTGMRRRNPPVRAGRSGDAAATSVLDDDSQRLAIDPTA